MCRGGHAQAARAICEHTQTENQQQPGNNAKMTQKKEIQQKQKHELKK